MSVISYSLDHSKFVNTTDVVIQNAKEVHVVFMSLLWEVASQSDTTKCIERAAVELKSTYINAKIVVILNCWYNRYQLEIETVDEICFIDFCLLLVYNRVFKIGQLDHATSWDPTKRKFLFLTGKPHKLNRIRLLYLFDQAGLLDQSTWSLFMPDQAFDYCHQLVPELSLIEFQEFVTAMLSNPDHVEVMMQPHSLHYGGIPFDYTMYADSKFQVISESNFETPTGYITEKTWLAILNHRPFILAADTGALKNLNSLGIRTFEKYLKISNYDEIVDNEQRLAAVVSNTEYWLDNIALYQQEIAVDVEHNYQLLKKLAVDDINQITLILDQYCNNIAIDQIVELHDIYITTRWQIFYNNIRDPSWPECAYEEQFYTLPEHIQKECIEVFGYTPWRKL